MANTWEKTTLIRCPLEPRRHLFPGRDSCHFLWQHLSQHVLRGLHILSPFCCRVWVAFGQHQLKAPSPRRHLL